MTDSIENNEISTANLGFTAMESWKIFKCRKVTATATNNRK